MLEGSVDIHVNTAPCMLPRVGNALDMARTAAAAGASGWVLLSHHESSVGRAAVVEAALPGFRCAGGVVLNDYVGGLNPAAVRGAFLSGGRFMWFPTLHAENHAKVVGKGRAAVGPGDPSAGEGISVLDGCGALLPAAQECIEVARRHGGIVGTGHVSTQEIEVIVDHCVARDVPVVINHPYFVVLGPEQFFAAMASKGAWIEVCGAVVMPVHPVATVEAIAALVRACTPERCLLASDGGSVQLPIPHEIVRSVGWNLVKHGIAEDAVRMMASKNPRRLLGWN
jgi:Family of unknown function (DUF6282)